MTNAILRVARPAEKLGVDNFGDSPMLQKFICKYCGCEFFTQVFPCKAQKRTYEFCSVACKNRYEIDHGMGRGHRNIKTCPICGKDFLAHRCKGKETRFCSRKCAIADRMRYAANHPKNPPQIFTCKQCGRQFERIVYPSSEGKIDFDYCSPACRNKARSIEQIPCPICGKLFTPRVNDTGKNGQHLRKRFCSSECGSASRRGKPGPIRYAKNPESRFRMHPKEEIEFIKQNYPTRGSEWVANELGLTVSAVRGIAGKRGIKLDNDALQNIIYKVSKERMTKNNPMKNEETRKKVRDTRKRLMAEDPEYMRRFLEGRKKSLIRSGTKPELKTKAILDQFHVCYEFQAIIKPGFIVDFLIGNVVLEVDGEYWHGHPRYEPLTPKQIWKRKNDAARDKYLNKCGYSVIRIWDSEICEEKVRKDLADHGVLNMP